MSPFLSQLAIDISRSLLHVSWIGAIVGCVAATADCILVTSASRYRAHATALAPLLVALPAVFWVVRQPLPSAPSPAISQSDSGVAATPAFEAPPPALREPMLPETAAVPLAFRSQPQRKQPTAPAGRGLPLLVSLGYAVGVCFMLMRLLAGISVGRRITAGCRRVREPTLLALVEQQVQKLALRASPAVYYCETIAIPVVVGLVRPVILLPCSIVSGLTPEQLQNVLTHELVHIRRFDHVAVVVQRLTEAVLFFHPAVWYLGRRVRAERENRCDDLVIASGADPIGYAESLCRVAELSISSATLIPAAVAADGGSPSGLQLRVRRLLASPAREEVRLHRSGQVAVMVLLALVVFGTGLVSVSKVPGLQNPSADPGGSNPHVEQAKPVEQESLESTSEQMQRAIVWLTEQQRTDGSWLMKGGEQFAAGHTGLALLAFQGTDQTGKLHGRRAMVRGLGHLARQEPEYTYAVALQVRALCERDPKEYGDQIRRGLNWLAQAQAPTGGWSYTVKHGGRADGSNTGYAIRALEAAKRRGIEVPAAVWVRACNYWLASQDRNGGWAYTPGTRVTPTMTLTGLHSLQAAKRVLDARQLPSECDLAIARAEQWCVKNAQLLLGPDPHWHYKLDVLTVTFHEQDSDFARRMTSEAIERLRKSQHANGSWSSGMPTAATCLAMQALQRAEMAVARKPGGPK